MTFTPWNKGKCVGQKTKFTKRQVSSLKDILKNKNKQFDLVLFSLGVDTMLRASDLLNLKVSDVMAYDRTIKNIFDLKQQKTKMNHKVQLSDSTIHELIIYTHNKNPQEYLFKSSRKDAPITREYYAKKVKSWCELLGLDPKNYSTHSLRRTRASYIYESTRDPELVRQLLGQKHITATSAYLSIDKNRAIELGSNFMMD
tara:strand:+ start:13134 stop:13733 length:600 start_codon:yes stop_codon:yes gene_type:complete